MGVACLLLAGCAAIQLGLGDPSAPVFVSGRVVDRVGTPIAGASIELESQDGEVSFGSVKTRPDGSFEARLSPATVLARVAPRPNGMVILRLRATGSDGTVFESTLVDRTIAGDRWTGDPPQVLVAPPAT